MPGLASLKKLLPSGGKDENNNTRFSQKNYYRNKQKKKSRKKSIDEQLRKEKKQVNELQKKEELAQLKALRKQLEKKHGQKSISSQAMNTIAPPTAEGTSEDIIEVFTGIGAGVPKAVENDRNPFNWEPGKFEPGEPNVEDIDMPDMGNLEPPIKDGEVEGVLNID